LSGRLLGLCFGRRMKEDIRGIYDGSIFYTIAERRGTRKRV
jgi:hypothetical protein